MKNFSIIINGKIIEYMAEQMVISNGQIFLYIDSEIVAFFSRGTSVMLIPND